MTAPGQDNLQPGTLALIGVTCAVCVANNYYSQPLLIDIARDLGMRRSLAGLVPTMTQAGIAAGMLLLLPLGDRFDNRRLVGLLLAVQAAALALMAATASASLYLLACVGAGLCGIVTYLLPAYATKLVAPDRRGAITGLLATGILTGIMLGRSVAGMAAYALGWRAVYVTGAGATAIMALAMLFVLPATPGLGRQPYGDLLRSLGLLLRTIPLLRWATLLQALSFGTFNALWVGLTLRLQAAPFDLNTRQIGEIALVAISAALAAPLIGRMADRRSLASATRISLVAIVAGWIALLLWSDSYGGIVAGMVLVGVGAIGTDVTLRTALYGLDPAIRMRLNAVYSAGTFVGGSLFSLLTPMLFEAWGWSSVVLLALAAGGAAFLCVPQWRPTGPRKPRRARLSHNPW